MERAKYRKLIICPLIKHIYFRIKEIQYKRRKSKHIGNKYIMLEVRAVWTADETLSQVFDISSQSKQKLSSKRRSKIVKIYAN